MFRYIAKKLWGNSNEKKLKGLAQIVTEVNKLEGGMQHADLKAVTERLKCSIDDGMGLRNILPEAFAAVREATKRSLGLRLFDVQIIGGIALHDGMIAEMKTGEGKTLVATLAAYLNALGGNGVHVVTVNDYLAKRDAEWTAKVYNQLGVSVSYLLNGMPDELRFEAYKADITYGTNSEFGFDYLRDNLKTQNERTVQRGLHYAIIDELDSILIDDARTPLIISGAVEGNNDLCKKADMVAKLLPENCYEIAEKEQNIAITDDGHHTIEQKLQDLGLIEHAEAFYTENINMFHKIRQALIAHKIYKKDKHYIVRDGTVYIIDDNTGRVMEGRRFSQGLHQAIEAKEKVEIKNETQTIASITIQNYFRMYGKLSGMTGTALTEAAEFQDIYNLDVIAIPTNVPVNRIDNDDIIYRTEVEKLEAVVDEITELYNKKQPVLVGTVSIAKSEKLSKLLKRRKVPHQVLNAKHHEKEAAIIAEAGRLGAVTIATNMAGRGTDIMLGGNKNALIEAALKKCKNDESIAETIKEIEESIKLEREQILSLGGLMVIGTERHESRRIDNQLRGRSGRQGDKGCTKFYVSLEDDLMRLFGSDKISSLLGKMGLKDGESIQHPWVSSAIERAQQKVEARNYEYRKNLLKYDDVVNDQRHVIYEQRKMIMSTSTRELIYEYMEDAVNYIVTANISDAMDPHEWPIESLVSQCHNLFGISMHDIQNCETIEAVSLIILNALHSKYNNIVANYSAEFVAHMQVNIMLFTIDMLWKEHLHALDIVRSGIHLRAYAQKNPLNEYKMEAFHLFEQMLRDYKQEVIVSIMNVHLSDELTNFNKSDSHDNQQAQYSNIGRNERCPCNSGKRYKHCHGSANYN